MYFSQTKPRLWQRLFRRERLIASMNYFSTANTITKSRTTNSHPKSRYSGNWCRSSSHKDMAYKPLLFPSGTYLRRLQVWSSLNRMPLETLAVVCSARGIARRQSTLNSSPICSKTSTRCLWRTSSRSSCPAYPSTNPRPSSIASCLAP